MLEQKQVKKIDYRLRRHNQPDDFEREEIKRHLYEFTTQANLARLFKTSRINVANAFGGTNATLMNKIKIYIEKMQTRKTA